MAGVKGVPVIPTAGVGLYGRGQRLEGSLVEESVGQARGRRPIWHSGRTAVPCSLGMTRARGRRPSRHSGERLCRVDYFLAVASRRSFRFEIPLAVGLCLRQRRLLSE